MQFTKSAREFGCRGYSWIRRNVLAAALLAIGVLGLISTASNSEPAPADVAPPPHSLADPYQNWAEHTADRGHSARPSRPDHIADLGSPKQ